MIEAKVERIKAITIHQPYAAWIFQGRKTLEIRGWRTKHRGLLAIHAGLTYTDPGKRFPTRGPVGQFEYGQIIAAVDLVAVRPFLKQDERAARVEWRPGLWAWVLENPTDVIGGLLARGRPGLWDAGPVDWICPNRDLDLGPRADRRNRG